MRCPARDIVCWDLHAYRFHCEFFAGYFLSWTLRKDNIVCQKTALRNFLLNYHQDFFMKSFSWLFPAERQLGIDEEFLSWMCFYDAIMLHLPTWQICCWLTGPNRCSVYNQVQWPHRNYHLFCRLYMVKAIERHIYYEYACLTLHECYPGEALEGPISTGVSKENSTMLIQITAYKYKKITMLKK